MDSLHPGAILRKKFLIESQIGRGGMGTVYKAVHIRMRTRVAIKILHRQHLGNPTHIQRFEREALAAARLRGSFAVRVFDVDTADSGEPFLVMELLRGRPLSQVIGDNSTPRETLIDWAIQICSAIHEAHELGIVHRDLKPANIFVLDESDQIKVVDFGISKVRDTAELTSDSEVVGTPQYMSPEQLLGGGNVGHLSDIWSMGVVLYRLLAREHPMPVPPDAAPFLYAVSTLIQEPVPILEHCPGLPEPLADAIMRCLEKEPEDRIGSARELADRLQPFGSGKVDFEVVEPRAVDSLPTLPDEREAYASVEEPLMPSGAPTAVEGHGASVPKRLPSADDAVVDELAPLRSRRGRVVWAAIGLVIVVGAAAYAFASGRGRTLAEGAPAAHVGPEPAACTEPASGASAPIEASAGAPSTVRSAGAAPGEVTASPTRKPPGSNLPGGRLPGDKPPSGKPPPRANEDNPWYL